MEELDGDGNNRLTNSSGIACKRDIVQFVPFRDFTGDNITRDLAEAVLAEIPPQVVGFCTSVQYFPPNLEL